jgi:hypothetical protein
MAAELTLDSVKDMKKAEFIKAFKNKAIWKKAKAVIVMVDYKLDGKKSVLAIPFKKETEMKAEMKRLKKEKLHLLKKTGGGVINFEKTADGMKAKIEIKIGGLAPEILLAKGQELFGRIKVTLEALQSAEAAADAAASAGEEEEEEEDTSVEGEEGMEEEEEEEEEEVQDDATIFSQLKPLMQGIVAVFKEKVQKVIVPAIKGNQPAQEHMDDAESLTDQIEEMQDLFESLSDTVKEKLNDKVQQILGLVPNLDKIKNKLADMLGLAEEEEDEEVDGEEAGGEETSNTSPAAATTATDTTAENPNESYFIEMLEKMEKRMNSLHSNMDSVENSIKNAAKEVKSAIASGAELLSELF